MQDKNRLIKALINTFKSDAESYGYEFDDNDTAIIASTVFEVIENMSKGSNVSDDQIVDFIKANDREIRARSLDLLDARYEANNEQNYLEELTYHPEHIRAHQIEDEEGGVWYRELTKSARWHDLPLELRDHLEKYHGENKVYHVHTDDFSDPMIYMKSAEIHTMNQDELVRGSLHEIVHRLDEKAYREIHAGIPAEVSEEEMQLYQELNTNAIQPGVVWQPDRGYVSKALSAHLNQEHGLDEFGNMRYEPHALEVPMIGPDKVYFEKEMYRKSLPQTEMISSDRNVVDSLREAFFGSTDKEVVDLTKSVNAKTITSVLSKRGFRFQKGPLDEFDEANPTGDYNPDVSPAPEGEEYSDFLENDTELVGLQDKPVSEPVQATTVDETGAGPSVLDQVLASFGKKNLLELTSQELGFNARNPNSMTNQLTNAYTSALKNAGIKLDNQTIRNKVNSELLSRVVGEFRNQFPDPQDQAALDQLPPNELAFLINSSLGETLIPPDANFGKAVDLGENIEKAGIMESIIGGAYDHAAEKAPAVVKPFAGAAKQVSNKIGQGLDKTLSKDPRYAAANAVTNRVQGISNILGKIGKMNVSGNNPVGTPASGLADAAVGKITGN